MGAPLQNQTFMAKPAVTKKQVLPKWERIRLRVLTKVPSTVILREQSDRRIS
jgi:hypothetical protein